MSAGFNDFVSTKRADPDDWRRRKILKPLVYTDVDGKEWTVPADFISDGASIPRFLWRLCGPPWGPYAESGVFHDWLYATGPVSRLEADRLFLEAMQTQGIKRWRRQAMYRGVRVGGWYAWNQHRAA